MRPFLPAFGLLLLLGSGCQQEPLCLACPDLNGVYLMVFQNDQSTGSCIPFGVNVPQTSLQLVQQGATLNGALFGIALTGNLFASGRLVLTGTAMEGDAGANVQSISLNGNGVVRDGGAAELGGTVTGQLSLAGNPNPIQCVLNRTFVANR